MLHARCVKRRGKSLARALVDFTRGGAAARGSYIEFVGWFQASLRSVCEARLSSFQACLISATQYGHNVWAFLGLPQPGHLTTLLTSFIALPASNLCLRFICEVFFFGTAFKMPSQMSESNDGMLMAAAGRAMFTDAVRSGLNAASACLEASRRLPLRSRALEKAAMLCVVGPLNTEEGEYGRSVCWN